MTPEGTPAAYRRLFEPLQIGNFTVSNRIVNPTHGTSLSEARELRYLQERARGGAGLIGTQASGGLYTLQFGSGPRLPIPAWDEMALTPLSASGIAHFDNVVIPAARRKAEVIHAEGARCYAQINYPGAGRHGINVNPALAPSTVGEPYEAAVPHALTEEQVESFVMAFAHSIRRTRAAGFDAAEIHGAHGYLVNEFLSPYFNVRTDRWGGSREGRARFVLEVLGAARRMVGDDFPIGIRVGVDGDGQSRGITIDELVGMCTLLAPHLSFISVSGGNYAGFGQGAETAYVSSWYTPPGFNIGAAAVVKAAVSVPVIVTGRIADGALAESVLAEGAADLIGMVRALIADPQLPNKLAHDEAGAVRACLGVSECHHIGAHRTPITCAVNAAAGREDEFELEPADHPKTVVVVGAGPAGLEAARVAALRGHRVFLADAKREIGGTPAVLGLDPNRRNLRDHAVFFKQQLARVGVELLLGNHVTPDEIVGFAPDAVVVATGGLPLIPDVPGIESVAVITALEAIERATGPGMALVVGGFERHLGPPTVAELLADRGYQVELISERFDFADGAEDGTRYPLRQHLLEKAVDVSLLHSLVSVDPAGAVVATTFTARRRRVAADVIVLACGLVPNDKLASELVGRVPELHVIGDALAPRRIMHATLEGARVAAAL